MPTWYGLDYPSIRDLEDHASMFDIGTHYLDIPQPAVVWDKHGPAGIIIPNYSGVLARSWAIAHELGHLVLGHGYIRNHMRTSQETDANRWAAGALIPEARVQHYRTRTVAGFLRAIGKHYQPVPPEGGIRPLACAIAYRRLEIMEG